ncbi:medium-chain acyl-CoA ligase ACSF2, mitochondrial-like [Synchiropus splendidus]|uniref:medium-chain acyl-CoA ligase ACSF2, mitochondrial-like n=1 Tax=Synchiropus splendidus TaxID=270530 RepID=UPI00237DD580|nr:medium-chain acyl-CoA ligase ACSF2, mitochondrial-like [Synchiropus splendidus]
MALRISSSRLRSCVRSVGGHEPKVAWKPRRYGWSQWCRTFQADSPPHRETLTSSYVHGTSSLPMLSLTVAQSLDQTVQRSPDREAVVFLEDGIRKTFAQFQLDVDKVAAGLIALGLKRGERLGFWGPNSYEWLLFQFATAKAGIILVSLNTAYQEKELEFILRKVQCNAIVCPSSFKTQRFCDIIKRICPEMETTAAGALRSSRLPHLRLVIVTESRQPGTLHMDDVFQAAESRHHKELMELQSKLIPDEPINIQLTSGTTGNPKGATLSHFGIVNNSYFAGLRLGMNRPARACVPVPLFHCFGSVLGGMCMAVHGTTLVFPSSSYNSRTNLQTIQDEKCNFIYGTPTMFIDMLSQKDLHKFDLSSAEFGLMGGSACSPEIVRRIKTDLNIRGIMVAYGSTESGPLSFLTFPYDNNNKDNVGHILPHTEAKVVDPTTGEMVPLGATGELMIRSSCLMHGYWDDEEKTREVIGKDHWYKTGDTASLDSRGYLRIEGRIKDMVIRGGENIYPAEIEQFLYTHPSVKEVQVIGVKDERLGEQVCACIRLKEGHTSSAEEITAFCKNQISHFKIPHYVVFVDSYPQTASGKIQKNKLREEMEKKLGLL